MEDNYVKINGTKISLNDDDVKELSKKYNKPKVDFSKYVGIGDGTIAIVGDGALFSTPRGLLIYDKDIRHQCIRVTPAYEEVNAKDLNYGDVFCVYSLDELQDEYLKVHHFGVFVAVDDSGDLWYQVLFKNHGKELIEISLINPEKTVVRFKREVK